MARDNLITDHIWRAITSRARRAKTPVYAAVAYFGQGASTLLPLPKNSRLVVDASTAALRAGQTCPADLIAMQRRGVRIFSVPCLHAKIYVFPDATFIGSANASNHSANTLIEAMIETTDKGVIRRAREFIRHLSIDELGPERLEELKKHYRPPRFSTPTKAPVKGRVLSKAPRVKLVHLSNEEPPSETKQTARDGLKDARKNRKHGRNYVFDYFWWRGKMPFYKQEDKVIQITEEDDGRSLVDAPADIIHLTKWRHQDRQITFAYYEHRKMRKFASKNWLGALVTAQRKCCTVMAW